MTTDSMRPPCRLTVCRTAQADRAAGLNQTAGVPWLLAQSRPAGRMPAKLRAGINLANAVVTPFPAHQLCYLFAFAPLPVYPGRQQAGLAPTSRRSLADSPSQPSVGSGGN